MESGYRVIVDRVIYRVIGSSEDRRSPKNAWTISLHSSSSTPPTTDSRWFSASCSCARWVETTAALGERERALEYQEKAYADGAPPLNYHFPGIRDLYALLSHYKKRL